MSIYSSKFILNEAYFKNAKVLEMEKCIGRYRKDIQRGRKFSKFNTHPELVKFNRLTEEAFGFDAFMLDVNPSIGCMNAMTLPISNKLDVHDSYIRLVADKSGFRYNNRFNVIVTVYSDILTRADITDREVMAIILHEIGHNFQDSVTNKEFAFTFLNKILILRIVLLNFLIDPIGAIGVATSVLDSMDGVKIKIDKWLSKTLPGLQEFIDIIKYGISGVMYLPTKLIGHGLMLYQIPLALSQSIDPIMIINKALKYNDEKFSDSFATMYGYGEDITSALIKLEYHNDKIEDATINKIPVVSSVLSLYNLGMEILYSGIIVHPKTLSRIEYQLQYLKDELKKNDLDPKMRKEIELQVNNIENMIKINIIESRSLKDQHLASKIYRTFIYKTFGKGDMYDFISNNDNMTYNIDNTFDRVKIQ